MSENARRRRLPRPQTMVTADRLAKDVHQFADKRDAIGEIIFALEQIAERER